MQIKLYDELLLRLESFASNIEEEPSTWRAVSEMPEPESSTFPPPFQDITDLRHLIIVKCLRPDRLLPAIEVYSNQFGELNLSFKLISGLFQFSFSCLSQEIWALNLSEQYPLNYPPYSTRRRQPCRSYFCCHLDPIQYLKYPN